jgi:multidrug transporter EmrE-like cation transporter
MFIYYVLLFLSALIFASQFFVTRQYQLRNGTGFLGSVKLSFFAYLTIAIFFFVKGCLTMGTLNFGFTWFTFAMTLLIAVVSLSCVYMGIKVLAVGDMSIYSVFMMLGSIILPSFVDLVFYYAPEKLSWLKAVALLLMIIAIIFSVSSVDKDKLTLKAILYYIGIFVMNGMIGVFFTIHQNQPELTAAVMQTADELVVNNDVFMTWYGISTVLLTGVIYGICYFVKPIKSKFSELDGVDSGNEGTAVVEGKESAMKALLVTIGLAAIYGLCNGVGDYFIAIATQPNALGASVTFPIINGGTIIFSTLSGILFFKEKLTVSTVISLVIVVISTVLFMFV